MWLGSLRIGDKMSETKTNCRHEFAGQKVNGDICNRCEKEVEWFHIPDSLASACVECGFVRVGTKKFGYEAGATIQEWLSDLNRDRKE
jgi:hypothetical protein